MMTRSVILVAMVLSVVGTMDSALASKAMIIPTRLACHKVIYKLMKENEHYSMGGGREG